MPFTQEPVADFDVVIDPFAVVSAIHVIGNFGSSEPVIPLNASGGFQDSVSGTRLSAWTLARPFRCSMITDPSRFPWGASIVGYPLGEDAEGSYIFAGIFGATVTVTQTVGTTLAQTWSLTAPEWLITGFSYGSGGGGQGCGPGSGGVPRPKTREEGEGDGPGGAVLVALSASTSVTWSVSHHNL